jgi:hypothetical protein
MPALAPPTPAAQERATFLESLDEPLSTAIRAGTPLPSLNCERTK